MPFTSYILRYANIDNDDYRFSELPHSRTILPTNLELISVSGRMVNVKTVPVTAYLEEVSPPWWETLMQCLALLMLIFVIFGDNPSQQSGGLSFGGNKATEESAVYLTFEINGKRAQGWVWHNPFKNGDAVKIAAVWMGDYYEVYGIIRVNDGVIALYPHCKMSPSVLKDKMIRRAIRFCIWSFIISYGGALIVFFISRPAYEASSLLAVLATYYLWATGIAAFLFTCIGFRHVNIIRRWKQFCVFAEQIFHALNFADAGNLDLLQTSAVYSQKNDNAAYGKRYFRYPVNHENKLGD